MIYHSASFESLISCTTLLCGLNSLMRNIITEGVKVASIQNIVYNINWCYEKYIVSSRSDFFLLCFELNEEKQTYFVIELISSR
jgi:hypothetical protein